MEDLGYSIALFVHIVGALGFFVALGLEWTGLSQIRSAVSAEQVHTWMGILERSRGFGFASMFATVITGFYMMVTEVGPVSWIIVTLGSLVLLIVLAAALTGPRMTAMGRALAMEKTPLSDTFRRLANQPVLGLSIRIRTAVALGIIFLKAVKPDLGASLLAIGVAMIIGLVSALPLARRVRAHETSTD